METEMQIDSLKAENARLKEEVELLRKDNKWLRRKVFGSMADRRAPGLANPEAVDGNAHVCQPTLFDDEYLKKWEEANAEAQESAREIEQERELRKKKAKEAPKLARAPRQPRFDKALEERHSTLDPEEVKANPEEYECIGEVITRTLRAIPAVYYLEVVHYPKYIKKSERNALHIHVYQAPAVPQAVSGCQCVGSEVLAKLIVDKFQWSIPEYRQVARMGQMGVHISTSTVNDWFHNSANKLWLLYDRLRLRLLSQSDYVQADEVPCNIADRPGGVRKGYIWQIKDMSGRQLGSLYYYSKGSRSKTVPMGLFQGYRGAVQVDGYAGYDFLDLAPDITLIGCMAHVRRKFTDAEREDPRAKEPLDIIALLYSMEEHLRQDKANAETIQKERRRKAEPLLNLLEAWMLKEQSSVLPKSTLGEAMSYAYRMMPRLRRYLLDPRYQIDNNNVERGNRTPVLGRKNYLFSGNDRGVEHNCIFYSLIETCKDCGVNPLEWLTNALALPLLDMTDDELDAVLPVTAKKPLQ